MIWEPPDEVAYGVQGFGGDSCTHCGRRYPSDDPCATWSSGEQPLPFCSHLCFEEWALQQPPASENDAWRGDEHPVDPEET